MRDRIENFVKENKSGFEQFEPPAGLWGRIEKQLDKQHEKQLRPERSIRLSYLLKLVATVVIVLAAGLFLWHYQQKEASSISNIDPHLAKQQVHYASLIEIKRTELKRIEKEEPQLYQEFSSEIKKMEDSYQKLKNDLPTSPNQGETVKAMIRNLQIQIKVLNQQLTIMQQINEFKKQQNETQAI